jgi:hypothetical protein
MIKLSAHATQELWFDEDWARPALKSPYSILFSLNLMVLSSHPMKRKDTTAHHPF